MESALENFIAKQGSIRLKATSCSDLSRNISTKFRIRNLNKAIAKGLIDFLFLIRHIWLLQNVTFSETFEKDLNEIEIKINKTCLAVKLSVAEQLKHAGSNGGFSDK